MGFLYSDGVYTSINAGPYTIANGINDLGQIVGSAGQKGFVYTQGTYTYLQVPGASYTRALGINNAGQIVGTYIGESGSRGFLYDSGTYYSMSLPDSEADAINANGLIVGSYESAPYVIHGFEAQFQSVPEPNAVLLLGSGLMTILCLGKRRRSSSFYSGRPSEFAKPIGASPKVSLF